MVGATARSSQKRRASSVARREATVLRREERRQATRRKLLESAARIIGRYGFGGCSVARVTARARVAHGTFYLYFQSQQEMFDLVLPTLGGEMLASIAAAIGGELDPLEVERRGFTANATYILQNPYMNRVTYEAQLYTPKVYAAYIDRIIDRYVGSFRRTIKRGRLLGASDEELRFVARMIVSARERLLLQLTSQNLQDPAFFGRMIDAYLRFVRGGLDI